MDIELDVERTKQQRLAWQGLSEPMVRRLLYGGAKGGGKSWFLCVWMFTQVWAIMVQAKLKPSKNPPHVAWFGRKQATDLTGTTLQTWREVIPEDYYVLRGATEKDPKHILIADRIAIDYGGLDKQENINKFNSAEYIIIAVDQAEEITRDDISTVRASLRMVLKDSNGKPLDIPYKELYTANPRQCWLKEDFITNPKEGNRYVRALPIDNPHLPGNYLQTLQDAFGHRPELLRAYKDGDWSAIEGANQVILDTWLARASGMPTLLGGKIISCDVARFGDDKTVIMVLDGSEIIERIEMGYSRTTDVSDALTALSRRHNNCQLVIDEIGIGGGVIDELHKDGRRVMTFNSSTKAVNSDKFYNLRAEAWWELAEHFAHGEIGCRNMSQELRNQLTSPCYDFRNGKIIIEPKELIKQRLGKSPDDADCYVMGVWAVKRSRPELQFQDYGRVPDVYDNKILTRGLRKTGPHSSPYDNGVLTRGLRRTV